MTGFGVDREIDDSIQFERVAVGASPEPYYANNMRTFASPFPTKTNYYGRGSDENLPKIPHGNIGVARMPLTSL